MRFRSFEKSCMKKPRAIVCVTNDLTTDQRVDRTCHTLMDVGYDVVLVGRKLRESRPLQPRKYRTHRLRLLFRNGPLFYACYNIRILLFLLTHRSSLIVSNDLDALPGCYLAYILRKRTTLIHDCHEYYRGVPELNGRETTKRIWKFIEDRIFPKLKLVTAVNDSVAGMYQDAYGVPITVIRNVPLRKEVSENHIPEKNHPTEGHHENELQKDHERNFRDILGIQSNEKIILYQGALNVDRGLEEAILSMKYLKTDARLVIAGTGDIAGKLAQLIQREGLGEQVILTGPIPFENLHALTKEADIGLSVEKNVSINYYYCLPNKFLDYIQANIPVLISPFPEMEKIRKHYDLGEVLESHEPEMMARQLDAMLGDPNKLELYKKNAIHAAAELNWENEEKKLIELIQKADRT